MLKNKKVFISLLLTVVLMVCVAFSPALSVLAASNVDTISEGESWRGNFQGGSETGRVIFKPTQNGFYTLTVTDYQQTSNVLIEIADKTLDTSFDFIYQRISEPYISDKMFMVAGHEYELLCYYSGDDYYSDLTADLSLRFDAVDFVPSALPYCQINSSDMLVNFEDYPEWFAFTTDVGGDYTLNYSNYFIDAYIEVYEAQSGELVDARNTLYYNSYLGWWVREGLIFTLEANTEYYFRITETQNSSTKLSMTKCDKDVKNIKINSAAYTIDSSWGISDISAALFDYKITYSDSSAQILDYDQLCQQGFEPPPIGYLGKTVDINGEEVLLAGKQSVVSLYDDEVAFSYIEVQSITDMFIDAGYIGSGEYSPLYVDFEDYDEHTAYWLIKVDKTGVYKLCGSNTTLDDSFSEYQAVMVDEQNNIVNSIDQNSYYWPLVAGREYAISFKHSYSEKISHQVNLYICKEIGTVFPDTSDDGWYYDAVTYSVGRGIMTGYASNGYFGTADGIQRQDFLVMLARLDGVDLTEYANKHGQFPDIAKNSYYEAAVMWGYENGIVTGYNNGEFGIGDKITREQLVTFLYRYAAYIYADTSYLESTKTTVKNKYSDFKNVTDFAVDPVLWAIEKGVISGKNSTTIAPQGNAQRCEVAQIMYNIFKNGLF